MDNYARFVARVTNMGDGSFRPEVIIDGDGVSDIFMGPPVASYDEARTRSDLMSMVQGLSPEDIETAIIAVKALKNDRM
jgi:hypothetical protein